MDQIKGMVHQNELREGDPIPSMRALARSLQVAVITVQHAYELLEEEGYIVKILGKGSFISAKSTKKTSDSQLMTLDLHLKEVAKICKKNNISLDKIFKKLDHYYKEGE